MKTVSTKNAPAAIGPYSQAVVAGGFVFTAGQIPLDPQTGEVVGEDIATQTEQVLKNISAILAAAGTDMSRVVRCDVFLSDLGLFAEFNKVYEKYFGDAKPARVTVEVSSLPKGVLVEIAAVAEIG